jgi:hypothetical protein
MFTEKNKIILIILIIGLLYGIQPIIFSKIIDYNIPKLARENTLRKLLG